MTFSTRSISLVVAFAATVAMVQASAQTAVPARPAGAAPVAAPAPSAPTATSADYRFGQGDILRINVFQNPELTVETRVSESGAISFPLVGTIKLGGLTAAEGEKTIADALRNGNFVKQPQVSILVLTVRGNQVSVLGQVNRAGRFPIEVSDMKLSDVLANAGGVAGTGADLVTLVGTRNGQPYRVEIDLPRMFTAGGRGSDVTVQNGDVIYVDRSPVIYIYGEVQRPGGIRLERNMTVMQALATGGGLTARGTEKGIRVHRRGTDNKVQIVQPAMDDSLQDGDVVFVRESIF